MAFSRLAAKAKASPTPPQDPEAAAWQAQLAKEQEESAAKAEADEKRRREEQIRKKSTDDARWREAHQVYSSNLSQPATVSRFQQNDFDEEKARQQRTERSRQEAAKRAAGDGGGSFGTANLGGLAANKTQSSGGYSSSPPVNMAGMPSHDECELAVSAMISKTQQGMKEGLRHLGLPDYPLKFTPGKEFELCGHNMREDLNEMIHAWMTEQKNEFYNRLSKIKNIVSKPILTDEEKSLMEQSAGSNSPAKVRSPTGRPDADAEVIDMPSTAAKSSTAPSPAPAAASAPADGDDHYGLLGVQPTATLQEIRMKFRSLVITEHPEKGGDPVKFAKLNKAYGVLSDATKRRAYDEQRQGS